MDSWLRPVSSASIAVPATAIVRRSELTSVYVLSSSNQPLLRPGTGGRSSGDKVEVLSGLSDGGVSSPSHNSPRASAESGRTMTQSGHSPSPNATELGVSGRIAAFFQRAQITPLLALVALLLGVFAVLVTTRGRAADQRHHGKCADPVPRGRRA